MSAARMTELILVTCSVKTIARRMAELVDAGYLKKIVTNSGWVGATAYWPDFEAVAKGLETIGYTMDEYQSSGEDEGKQEPSPAKPGATPTGIQGGGASAGGDPAAAAPSEEPYDSAKEWQKLSDEADAEAALRAAAATKLTPEEKEGLKRLSAWAMTQKMMDRAPDNVKYVSWMLAEQAGINPFGKEKAWFAQSSALWEACEGNHRVLLDAIRKAVQARTERGLTLSSPMSFISFARDALARQQTPLISTAEVDHGRKEHIVTMPSNQRVEGGIIILGGNQ